MAERYWPGQDALGRRLQFTPQFPWVTVIGVVADTRYRELTREWLTVYFPAKQFFFYSPGAIVVRTTADPTPLFADIRRTIQRAEPAAAVHSVASMDQLLARESAGAACRTRRSGGAAARRVAASTAQQVLDPPQLVRRRAADGQLQLESFRRQWLHLAVRLVSRGIEYLHVVLVGQMRREQADRAQRDVPSCGRVRSARPASMII